ncbi:FadR/GntR family transcriptional regulator [Cohaesibacter celericrescens]|uniref:GntR family transcriptional regulator n=1 Tax=Cohaesibacter celericrescens TaxID=2067669 RepID=A0A2N5XS15_9HYPH|nr:FadR/GntR family transcriptional regulator [Cohaesibacter celericrescens]PLW77208.1 GntR family transcriptional regulator [Cohaesibacter celericrescens]
MIKSYNVPPLFEEALRPSSARDLVASKISSLIATGVLSIGDDLPSERELAVSFGLSRSSIRSGIQLLSAKGIVQIAQGVKTRVISDQVEAETRRVRPINEYNIEEIHAARMSMEVDVIRSSAQRIDDDTLAKLEEMLAAQYKMINDPVRFLVSDRGFHISIYESCGNRILADFVFDLYGYEMARRRKIVAVPSVIEASCREHEKILAGLKKRDPDAASQAFAEHLQNVYITTKSLMRDS